MRCHFVSDLHLERQDFDTALPEGDLLIVAGDLCQAGCLDPSRTDRYAMEQRGRVLRFRDQAVRRFQRVLMIAGNHEHFDGVFEETIGRLRQGLDGITVLDDEAVEISGIVFFGTTLWSAFGGGTDKELDAVRRRLGEFFFVKTRSKPGGQLRKFQPEDALAAHRQSLAAVRACLAARPAQPTIVVSHHAPSRLGLNPRHTGNGLDGAYASDLDALIAEASRLPVWVHGHTHMQRRYQIGSTEVVTHCRGFDGVDNRPRRSWWAHATFELAA